MLIPLFSNDSITLHKIDEDCEVSQYISSTPEGRQITNDPLLFGVQYTNALREACAKTIKALYDANQFQMQESHTCVLNILRGGLNFGLREALSDALGWNSHATAFLSAQREQDPKDPKKWYITENTYAKFELEGEVSIVLGDVIATGTSLEYGLRRLVTWCQENRAAIKDLVVFTIGGPRSTEILQNLHRECKKRFPNFRNSSVIYLEGRFYVPSVNDTFKLALSGTDLMRTQCAMAPEFIKSQNENPCFPLERCTIYDAGSRAFHCSEYLRDVTHYWSQVVALAKQGLTYEQLLKERCPECTPMGTPDLLTIAQQQYQKLLDAQ